MDPTPQPPREGAVPKRGTCERACECVAPPNRGVRKRFLTSFNRCKKRCTASPREQTSIRTLMHDVVLTQLRGVLEGAQSSSPVLSNLPLDRSL